MEIWKPIPGFVGRYEASDHGRVRSLDRIAIGRDGVSKHMQGLVLQAKPNTAGYLCVRLGRNAPAMVHRLVASAFIGPSKSGHYVCHGDGNRLNNSPTNLRYDTPRGNQSDRAKHGTTRRGSALPQAKLNEAQAREIKALLETESHARIAQRYLVSKAAVFLIAAGRNWKHV